MPAGTYDVGDYPVERLQQYAKNTNDAIAQGFSIPLIDRHADLDNLPGDSAIRTCGEVKCAFVENGWLGYELAVVDDEAAKRLPVLKTSPEFRERYTYNGIGTLGPHIRHVALTSKPRNPRQGPFEIVGEGVARFSLDEEDMADDSDLKTEDIENADETANELPVESPEAPNPDMPPSSDGAKKMAAVVAGLAELGVVLPADFKFESEGAIDILLTGLNTAVQAKQQAETPTVEEDEPEVSDVSSVNFSEDELAALPPAVRAALKEREKLAAKNKELQQVAVRFSEERRATAREKIKQKVSGSKKLTPALREKLLAKLNTVQFGEDKETPSLTIGEVVDIFEGSMPKSLVADKEPTAKDVEHPDGSTFFSGDPKDTANDKAKEINDEWDKSLGYREPRRKQAATA